MKTALITGGHGFLGRHVAAECNRAGYEVYAIGIGTWEEERPEDYGIEYWCERPLSVDALTALPCSPNIVIHCAGSGSVGFSLSNPYLDFSMTVNTTAAVLEYIRTAVPDARFVYPSSAAVYGCRHEGALREDYSPAPVSPYGVHKLMAEQLCVSAYRNFELDCHVVRFFSLYGPGLRKQLLWDASNRIAQAGDEVLEFFGTGRETRDWLHVRDAATLMLTVAEHNAPPPVVNGASGVSCSVRAVLEQLLEVLASRASISFNGQVREGDPEHLVANLGCAAALGWKTEISLADGLREYAEWFNNQKK